MQIYDQLLTIIRDKMIILDDLAMELEGLEWMAKPSGQGLLQRPWDVWLPSEKRRYLEIEKMSDKLDKKIYHAQLLAEEYLDGEQIGCLINAVGDVSWYCHRTQYMPQSEADNFLISSRRKNKKQPG